jgi:2-polyprenyl-6-methoxyphenol hydroxylase-like FAD-dependent oxidoreductase
MSPEDFGAVTMRRMVDYSAKGAVIKKVDLTESNKLWQDPWQLSHRVRLHDTLKLAATYEEGAGKPAKLSVSSRVSEVYPETATVVLENGEKIESDLIIVADGIHVFTPAQVVINYPQSLKSQTRTAVAHHPGKFIPSGKAAFRFLIPRKDALSVADAAAILEEVDQLSLWYGDDRRVVMYPCNDNKLLNFVCIHPEAESQGSAEGTIRLLQYRSNLLKLEKKNGISKPRQAGLESL